MNEINTEVTENSEFAEKGEGIGLGGSSQREVARIAGFASHRYMKITLSLPKDLVNRVRRIAVERDTTLTDLVRGYLNELGRQDVAMGSHHGRERLEHSFRQFQFRVGNKCWKREELHERA
jgi:hypothetical protein